MIEHIGCKRCDSPNCKGCNMLTLERMLNNGKFNYLMNENRSIDQNAEVEPVKHGRWIPDDKFPSGKSSIFHCSECYYTRTTSVLYTAEKLSQDDPYCKKCGAKMDGTTEDKENENHG